MIAIDLDDTLVDSHTPFVEFQNREYGLSLTVDDYTDDRFWIIWKCDLDEAVRRTFAFHRSEDFQLIRPIPGAHGALKRLHAHAKARHRELHVVTARPNHLREQTPAFVEHHFPGLFSGVHFANTYDPTIPIRTKAEVCVEIGAEDLVDDTHRHAHGCAEAGINVCLVDFPWNRGITKLHHRIQRIKHIREALPLIMQRAA